MKHIFYRLATVCILVFVLVLGTTDVYSAKKNSLPDNSGATSTRLVDTTHTVKTRATQPVNRDVNRRSLPATTTYPAPTAPAPALNESNVGQTSTSSRAAAAIQNNWISINHGGVTEVSAGNLKMGISIAQPVAGFVEGGGLQLGLGYWYGAAAGSTGPCDCPRQADFSNDGIHDNLDLNLMIAILFFDAPNIKDPNCPAVVADFNCDGAPDNLDLNLMITYLFFNGAGPCQPCDCNSYPSDCPPFP